MRRMSAETWIAPPAQAPLDPRVAEQIKVLDAELRALAVEMKLDPARLDDQPFDEAIRAATAHRWLRSRACHSIAEVNAELHRARHSTSTKVAEARLRTAERVMVETRAAVKAAKEHSDG